jgi:DNA-formamidopyrimidine glycosylase
MPELPEVETVVRGLRASLPGRQIVGVRLGKSDFIDDPVFLGEHLPGNRVASVSRCGKFIAVQMELRAPDANPEARLHLVIHLGMTGRLTTHKPSEPALPHTHVFFSLDDGNELRYTDTRRFGRMLLATEAWMQELRVRWGRDPLEIGAAEFVQLVGSRGSRIKALLLDQHILSGVGNIYADESLWRARIHRSKGLVVFRLRGFRRPAWQLPEHASRLSKRRKAVPPLRAGDPEDSSRGAQQPFLSRLPACAASEQEAPARQSRAPAWQKKWIGEGFSEPRRGKSGPRNAAAVTPPRKSIRPTRGARAYPGEARDR